MENQVSAPLNMRSYGLGRNFSRAARVLLVLGATLLATGLVAETAFAAGVEPVLTATSATFQIPNNPNRLTFLMRLYAIQKNGHQNLIGQDSGRSGELVVMNHPDPTCFYQVDVYESVHLYAGFRQQLRQCSNEASTTTSSSTSSTTTSTTSKVTTTTSKPKTTGSHSATTTTVASTAPSTTSATGPATKSATSVPPSALAFTGAGPTMWILAAIGGFFVLAGGLLMGYTRRYRRAAPLS
jgi:hypothetical protein